jgi:4'-phosphopantetheinyl transferase
MIREAMTWRAAPSGLTFPTDHIDIWRVCLVHGDQSEQELCGLLTPDEVARASRFHFEEDRRQYIRGRAALRMLLGRYLETPPAEIRFQYENHGKPEIALPRTCRGLRFNFSDSGGLALIAVGSGSALGVDIERVRPLPDFLDIATRFFSAREVQALLALNENKRQEAFFACWTRKEAYLKATGIGLLRPLSDFSVSVDPDEVAELREVKGNKDMISHWFLTDVLPGEGFRGAFACEGGRRCISQWICDPSCACHLNYPTI